MSKQTCEKCGATLPAPGATCRRCMMELAASWKPETGAEPVTTKAPRPGVPPPQPAELAPLFPELEIESLLGAGGMGAVYKAKQKRLGRSVALKVLHDELSDDALFVERFLREAQALAKLAHPGIVSVHDFGEREGRCYLVMEYVDGANLRVLLKQGLLAPRQSLDIVRQLCDALQFAHDEGVVHRDIKPENVLVDTNGHVKIADFGLAKLLGGPAQVSLTSAGQVMGTPHYMAPEQVEHPRDVDHRADLYSLGVVFYEMLTGQLPLGRFLPPSERVQVDVRLDEIVLKSLEHQRERRYQHAVQVKTDVERIEHEPAAHRRRRHLSQRLRTGLYLPRVQSMLGAHRPTAWGWLALFTAAWIECGTLFDFDAGWFLWVSIPLLTWLFVSMAMDRSDAERPEERLAPWISRLGVGASFLAALGFAELFVAHIALWERFTWAYVSSDQAPMAAIERWDGGEPELLRVLGVVPRPDIVPSDLRLEIDHSYSVGNPYAFFGLHPVLHFVAAGALLLWAAWRATKGSPRSASERRVAVAWSMALLLTPLVSLHTAAFFAHGLNQYLDELHVSLATRGDAETLGENLRAELVARDLEVHAEHSAKIVDRKDGSVLAEVRTFAAGPASPFERWRTSWEGPKRLEPHVLYTVVSDPTGEKALLLADGGLVDPAQLATNDWNVRLRELLASASAPNESR